MADVAGKFYSASRTRQGVSVVNPGFESGQPQDPVNPPGSVEGPSTYIQLLDTPNTYSGQANKVVKVKSDESGLEFINETTVSPNGLVVIGTVDQTGNDIDVNPDWVWRFNQVIYQKTTITPFTITPTASNFTRIDLVSGNTSGNVIITVGTAVEDPAVAVAPNVPANNVGFFLVFVSDTGITAFQNFALSSFVRFDINNQGLSAVQRQNARTNIQSLARDVLDTKTEPLRFRWSNSTIANGAGLIDVVSRDNTSESTVILNIRTNAGNELLRLRNRGDIYFDNVHGGASVWVGMRMSKAGSIAFEYGRTTNQDINVNEGAFKFFRRVTALNKSSVPTELTRRDELPLNYPQTVATSGIIDDLSLTNEGIKLLVLTNADELTGVVPVTTNTGRELKIESRVAGGTIIRHDSASSTAANRFSLPGGTDLTINQNEIYTFIYTNGRWRRVL